MTFAQRIWLGVEPEPALSFSASGWRVQHENQRFPPGAAASRRGREADRRDHGSSSDPSASKRGILDNDFDGFAHEQPILAGMTSASVMGLVSTGDRAGLRVRRVLSDPAEAVRTGPLCYASSGFSLHAATRISAGNKSGLERLCNYVSRPPLAQGSLTQLPNDEYAFKLKTPWSDGTTHLIFFWARIGRKARRAGSSPSSQPRPLPRHPRAECQEPRQGGSGKTRRRRNPQKRGERARTGFYGLPC